MDPRADARTPPPPATAPAEDLAYEREVLDESIRHDYSTSDVGIVPLTRRRPMWHFMGLWTTFVAGFSYMFLGFELHDGGHSLASTVGITVLGYALYVAYALVGSYLGARTGQTHALLTRSIFGLVGSWIVSAFILVAPLGWVAFQANLLVTLWDGFYGWGHVFTLTLLFAGAWFVLFTMAGWMMEQLAGTTDTAAAFRFTVHYSLFGAFWLAWIIATVSQFAINDGNYYESVNAGQNLIGGWRLWRRAFTCLIVAGGGVIAADLVNFHFLNGWFKVATFLAITVPCATVIMALDHFLLPRLFRISRPLTRVPAWEETGLINLPAVVALLAAVFFGVTGTANWPHGWIYSTPQNGWGPVPLESWLIAGALYVALVAVVRAGVLFAGGPPAGSGRSPPPSWPEWERFVRAAIGRFHRPDERISICPA